MIDRIFMHRSVAASFIALGILLASLEFPAYAADSSPKTRAARLTYMQGTVTVAGPDNAEAVPAQLNLPLLSGIQLITGTDGQAEVEFEDGSVVRLTPNSALSLDSLKVQPDGVFLSRLSLLHGLAYCELRATSQYQYTLNAGGDVLSPVENTTVRVNFDESQAIFSVLDGTAQIDRQSAPAADGSSGGYETRVRAGENLRADPADPSRYFLTQQIVEDSWDQWNEDRDQSASSEAANSTGVRNNYAGAQGYGWSDLDANGSWYDVPGQGQVWQPQIAVDDSSFDPYANGAWVWYPNTGYLWASSYSWGWTPYRCGNWSYYSSFGWGWAPGGGCGGRGWGLAGGGRPVNIGQGPTGYRPLRVPLANGPHRLQPILPPHPVKAWVRQTPTENVQSGPRKFAGVPVTPIKPLRGDPLGDENHATSSLRRDFPIDAGTRTPVLGLASTSPTVIHTDSGLRSNEARPGNPENSVQGLRQPSPYTPYGGQPNPARGQSRGMQETTPTPPSAQIQSTIPPNLPANRGLNRSVPPPAGSGSPATHRTYAPMPQSTHPTYAPAPQTPHPTSAPPPPTSHPSYSPPPPAPRPTQAPQSVAPPQPAAPAHPSPR